MLAILPSFFFCTASIVLFIFAKNKVITSVLFSILYSTIGLGYLFFAVSDFFTGEGVTSGVIYHIFQGELLTAGLFDIYRPYIMALVGIILFGLLLLATTLYAKAKARSYPYTLRFASLALLLGVLLHPLLLTIYSNTHTAVVQAKEVETFIEIQQESEPAKDPRAFDTYYESKEVTQTTTTPNNLVLIYLEGLEYTYSTGDVFTELTPHLQELEREAVTFIEVSQVAEASYTIAGFVASQCGIPLMAFTHGNTGEGYVDSYLSGATCLGDILNNAGYTTEYIGGANTQFAGKGTFLRSHGYQTVSGLPELTEAYALDDSASQGWGVYDDVMFDIAKERFDTLAESTDPFLLTLLTLDTHPPDGFMSETCVKAGIMTHDMVMKNAVACSDYLLAQFVDHIKASDAFQRTTIVIVSDHLAMNSPITPLLEPLDRTNRFHVISSGITPGRYHTKGNTLDIGTTVLPYIGYTGTIGLGQDLRHADSGIKSNIIKGLYSNWKKDIITLWEFPTLEQGILFDPNKQEVSLDGKTYTIPAIVTLDQTLQTTIGFKKYLALDLFFTLLPNIPPTHLTFIIDRCRMFVQQELTDLVPTLPDNFCIGLFQDENALTIQEFMEPVYISNTEISNFYTAFSN